jgi:hypothetical protein
MIRMKVPPLKPPTTSGNPSKINKGPDNWANWSKRESVSIHESFSKN